MTDEAVLAVEGLRVELVSGEPIVEELDLTLRPGEALGLVGESGSGKTTAALALLGYRRPGVRFAAGAIRICGESLLGRSERQLRGLRGRLVSYVPQEPASALNPSVRIGDQIRDVIRLHARSGDEQRSVAEALERVHLPSDRGFRRRFPHELSGGQQQRVAIALALVCDPPVVVLDEPTTGLDVVTQARILDEIRRLRARTGAALVYVSHDLAVVASIADRISVMYAGRVVEEGPADVVLGRPRHPYSRGLVMSIPDHVVRRRLRGIGGVAVGVGERPGGCAFAPRCELRIDACEAAVPPLERVASEPRRVRCIRWEQTPPVVHEPALERALARARTPLLAVETLTAVHAGRGGTVVAARDVSFAIAPSECVALVGESGSGKTTIARCVAGLHRPAAGRVLLDGVPLAPGVRQRPIEARRRIQIVFQNPSDSLNPRRRVRDEVARAARVLRGLAGAELDAEVTALLERVRLPLRLSDRFPAELSGGERQRVAIARALAAGPGLLVCDEITSALDASVQAAVIELLASLRAELGLALLFISHDLGVVASVADSALVLEQGEVRDQGPVDALLGGPAHEYTRRLVEAAPRLAAQS